MSIQAIAWVLEHSQTTFADRLVLLAIANHADAGGGVAYPSIDLIAEEARVDRTTVFRCLRHLEALGELEVARGRGRGRRNVYLLKGLQDATQTSLEKVASEPKKVASARQKGGTYATRTVRNRQEPREDASRTTENPLRCPVCDKLTIDCLCGRGPLLRSVR